MLASEMMLHSSVTRKCNPRSRKNMTNVDHDHAELLGRILDFDVKTQFFSLSS